MADHHDAHGHDDHGKKGGSGFSMTSAAVGAVVVMGVIAFISSNSNGVFVFDTHAATEGFTRNILGPIFDVALVIGLIFAGARFVYKGAKGGRGKHDAGHDDHGGGHGGGGHH